MMTAVAAILPRLRVPQAPWWASISDTFERARDGIAVLDSFLRVVVWNRAASLLTGAPASDTVGYGCAITGNLLTVDLSRRPPEPASVPVRGSRDVRLCEVQIRTRGGALAVPNVVATLIPVPCDEAHSFVHLSPGTVLRRPLVSADDGLPATLTEREYEILSLLASGKTAKPIASELSLSLPTVRTHIRHILRKLGVHSCLEAAVWFLRDGPVLAGDVAAGLDVASRAAAQVAASWVDEVVAGRARAPRSERATFV